MSAVPMTPVKERQLGEEETAPGFVGGRDIDYTCAACQKVLLHKVFKGQYQ